MAIALSGSLILSGSITVSGSIISTGTISMSGSIASASYANNATTASYALNATTGAYANTATSASYALNATTFNGLASSIFATTGSNTFIGTQTITGSVLQSGSFTTTGTIIAQTINVQQVTSSIVYSCGSNIFGTSISNTQQLTGSVGITGSLTIAGASSATSYNGATIFGSTIACSPIGCFATSCATSFIGGTLSGTTIYGSTAVCSPSFISSGTICSTGNTCFGGMSIINNCLGIGTATPQFKLDIQGGSLGIYHNTNYGGGASGAQLYLGDMNFAGGGYACSAPGIGAVCSPSTGVAGDLAFYNYTGIVGCRVERMRIVGGNVGIGTSSPCTLLHTVIPTGYGTNGTVANSYPVATFSQCDCGAGARGLQIGVPTGGVVSPVFLKVNNTGARFSIIDQSNCENFTISGGKVGIGTTTPEYPLHIYICNRTGMKIQTCDSTFGSPSINLLNVGVDTVLTATNTGLEIGTWSANDILFRTTQIERMRITSAGIACFACQVCAPSGVKFGSGTTTLNYYEEGSWTPTFSNSSTTPSYLTQFGRYTRIGRVVHVVGKIGASNLGSGTLYVGGLPFGSADASDSGQRVSLRAEGDWSGFNCTYLLTSTMLRASGTTFIGVRDSGNGQSIYADHSHFSSTLYFNFHGTYYV
jgi:hypothetical protein